MARPALLASAFGKDAAHYTAVMAFCEALEGAWIPLEAAPRRACLALSQTADALFRSPGGRISAVPAYARVLHATKGKTRESRKDPSLLPPPESSVRTARRRRSSRNRQRCSTCGCPWKIHARATGYGELSLHLLSLPAAWGAQLIPAPWRLRWQTRTRSSTCPSTLFTFSGAESDYSSFISYVIRGCILGSQAQQSTVPLARA